MFTSFSDWGFKDGATLLQTGDPMLGHSLLSDWGPQDGAASRLGLGFLRLQPRVLT